MLTSEVLSSSWQVVLGEGASLSYRAWLFMASLKETIKQFPDDSDYQLHEPRLPQKSLEIADQLLTLVVLPTFLLLDHGLAPVWCPVGTPCDTRSGETSAFALR